MEEAPEWVKNIRQAWCSASETLLVVHEAAWTMEQSSVSHVEKQALLVDVTLKVKFAPKDNI